MALRRSGAKELERLIRHTRLALNRTQATHDGRTVRAFESSLTRETQRSQDWKDFSNAGKKILTHDAMRNYLLVTPIMGQKANISSDLVPGKS